MKINNRIALDEIMLSHEKREALVSSVKRLANDVTVHKTKGDIITDDTNASRFSCDNMISFKAVLLSILVISNLS